MSIKGGYKDAKNSVNNGGDALTLLNQTIEFKIDDDYSKGWITACEEKIDENNI